MDLTWEAVSVLVTITTAIVGAGVWLLMRAFSAAEDRRSEAAKRIEDNQQDIKFDLHKLEESYERRVDRIEQKMPDFMSRTEIIAAIEHEKANRMSNDQALHRITELHANEIVSVKVHAGKLESSHDGLAAQVGEVKQMLKEQRVETNQRLDKIADCMADIAKRVS